MCDEDHFKAAKEKYGLCRSKTRFVNKIFVMQNLIKMICLVKIPNFFLVRN
jgi:hypothetical protein